MKTPLFCAALAAALLVAALQAQPSRPTPQQEFMRQKLEYAKGALEGLAKEDYDLIERNARRMSAMSRESAWHTFDNPGYARHSDLFRRYADSLAKAAGERNLDAATLAYVKVTTSCVDCHKFVRGKETAQLPGSPTFPPSPVLARH